MPRRRTGSSTSCPEVEQAHDPERKGAAVLVDVTRLSGFTLEGQVRMERIA
jgi:hypothetical protein